MLQTVKNFSSIAELKDTKNIPAGDSASPKGLIFHILEKNESDVNVLDVGFGAGGLGRIIRSATQTSHWNVDGIDGWESNCLNKDLINDKIYRNIWHGLAQNIPTNNLKNYNIICLLDVIEHLNAETAKQLLKTLLMNMAEESFLFISTPLWFYPQNHQQENDLEEHLIGVPISSMIALIPIMYSISHPLVGGFVLSKKSLEYIDFFQPTENKNFSYEMGLEIIKSFNIPHEQGVVYKTNP